MSERIEISRRKFLTAGAVAALSAGTGTGTDSIVKTASAEESPELDHTEVNQFGGPGSPSRRAERAWAEAEYSHYQQWMRGENAQQEGPSGGNSSGGGLGSPTSPNFSRTVNAIADLGCDPNGNRPITGDIDSSAIQDGTLIVFPPGKYLLNGKWTPSVDGTFGIAGVGYEQASSPPKSEENAAAFVAADGTRAAIHLEATTGLLANFILDQTGNNNSNSLLMRSSGFVQARDIRYVGTQDNTGSSADEDQSTAMCRFVTDEGATARAERVVGKHIGLPGDKNSGGAPMFWVGVSNKGTAQMGNCVSIGAADNGLYGGRTPGKAQVKGGTYKNNAVSQLRYDGAESWADGVTMIVDADNYNGPTNGPGYNEKFGVQGLKTERRKFQDEKASGAVLRNADVQVKSTNQMGAPIYVRGWAGSLKIENSRIVSQLDQPTIVAQAPGEGHPATRPPHNITITDSEIVASYADPVINISGRENSIIRNTCIKVPGATQDSVKGMRIGQNVGFGEQCQAGGLKNPEKVGASGNLSAVNISYNGSGVAGGSGSGGGEKGPRKGVLMGVVNGFFTLLLLLVGTFVLFVGGILGALGALISVIGGD